MLSEDRSADFYRADVSLVPHILEVISESQGVDWVEWPKGDAARRYRANRHLYDPLADVVASRTLGELLFPGQRFAAPAAIEHLERVGDDVVKLWLREQHRGKNAAVIVVGNIDQGATLAEIKDAFSSWKAGAAGPSNNSAPSVPKHENPTLATVRWPTSHQSLVSFGCRLPSATVETVAWQDLFAQAIGNALDRVVRERLGASYGFTSRHEVFRGGATKVVASALIANDTLALVVKEVQDLIVEMGKGRWPQMFKATTQEASSEKKREDESLKLLDVERWQYLTRFLLGLQTSEGVAHELFFEWNMGWPVDGGRAQLASLVQRDPGMEAALARQCHDSAAVVVAAPDETLAALTSAWRR
jgi:predicted Zn-dependent peptidase